MERIIPPIHLSRLHTQTPRPFYTTYTGEHSKDTVLMPVVHTTREKDWTLVLLFWLPFFSLIALCTLMIWLIPLPIEWVYRLVSTILFLLLCGRIAFSLEAILRRRAIPHGLMTQRVPCIKGDPLKGMARELEEDTDLFLARVNE
jgi:hypothetical protein